MLSSSCIETPNRYSAVPPGPWVATLNLAGPYAGGEAFEERTKGLLPFNFNVIYDTPDEFHIEIVNGVESILIDDINFGRDNRISKDTMRINLPIYGSYIIAKYEEDAIEGNFYMPSRGPSYVLPFRARHGKVARFNYIEPPVADVTGDWAVMFETETDNPYPAIGSFVQTPDGKVTGTFKTETGDYRYLQGKMAGDRLYMSAFDGAHAFLFEAKYFDNETMSGVFRSGQHYKSYWTASRDTMIELTDPYEITYLQDGIDQFEVSFPNMRGDTIRFSDEKYQGKPKVIQVFGTWCPNCRDETQFLVDYCKANPNRAFEIIGLAVERNSDESNAYHNIERYIEHFGIDYEILYAGTLGQAKTNFSMVNSISSYPTMLFLNADNQVVKTYTGFYGPATDEYMDFIKEFDLNIAAITKGE